MDSFKSQRETFLSTQEKMTLLEENETEQRGGTERREYNHIKFNLNDNRIEKIKRFVEDNFYLDHLIKNKLSVFKLGSIEDQFFKYIKASEDEDTCIFQLLIQNHKHCKLSFFNFQKTYVEIYSESEKFTNFFLNQWSMYLFQILFL